jgi:hypothetical protein
MSKIFEEELEEAEKVSIEDIENRIMVILKNK